MAAKGVVLAQNATATTLPVFWGGGKSALVLNATAYGTTVSLQLQGPTGVYITVNAVTYSADQLVVYDLPAGQYRISCSGGTTTALYASLVSVPYT
jgi:hypothetical protein